MVASSSLLLTADEAAQPSRRESLNPDMGAIDKPQIKPILIWKPQIRP